MLVLITELREHPDNPNTGDVEAIAASLERFGQERPLVTNTARTVVGGNHVLKAARSLGWTHIAAHVGKFKDEREERAYLLADNKIARLGGTRPDREYRLLREIGEGNLSGTGYTIDDVEDLAAQLDMFPKQSPEFSGGSSETPEELAQRQEKMAKGLARREIVLLLLPEDHEKFKENIRQLQKASDESSAVAIILRAVEYAAEQLAVSQPDE